MKFTLKEVHKFPPFSMYTPFNGIHSFVLECNVQLMMDRRIYR